MTQRNRPIHLVLNFLSFFSMLLLLSNCTKGPDSIDKKNLLTPNPTSCTFNMPVSKLRDTVVKLFGIDPQMDNKTLMKIFFYRWPETGDSQIHQAMFEPETSDMPAFGSEYFKQKQTKDDVFLTPMADYWASPVYFHKNKPFDFTSSFSIKFKPVTQNTSSITIIAYKPVIFNGTKCCGPHGKYAILQTIESTTIEEYTLVLYLAEKLGVKNLKPLRLPEQIST